MKTKPDEHEDYVPTALRQVWEWKDAIYQETKHLPTREALREITRMAHEVAVARGFVTAELEKFAENPPPYGAQNK